MKLGAASKQRYCEKSCAGCRCCGGFDCCYDSVLVDGWRVSIGHDDEEERPEEQKKLYAAGGERLVAKRMNEEDEEERM